MISEIDMLTFEESECLFQGRERGSKKLQGLGIAGWVISSHSERSSTRDRMQRADAETRCLNSRKAFHMAVSPVSSQKRSFLQKWLCVDLSQPGSWGQREAPKTLGL